ncbi:SMC4 [Candida pseudojiufengensis]|uniref:SMC4 n=1 Tax=Candida pseudojiufengensis TaxID=497109 RepID=UPI002224D1AF|nr:SMC4 [Candida pseudojiufengensis]KAI5964050.1 SMC4 [Candida pseudojiufengensis]
MKRKRLISDDEENDTFINNSDYDSDNKDEPDKQERIIDQSLDKGNEITDTVADTVVDTMVDTNYNDSIEKEIESPQLESHENVDAQDEINNESSDDQIFDKSDFNNIKNTPEGSPDPEIQISQSKPRLVINKLVLTNFKSYAGEQIIGPFHTSFSSVVGPNGSGKSNVIDSMLFVFGFKANKMRQGKISDLIHNSGGERAEFCQVDIHFEMIYDDSGLVVENFELIISRRATMNNQSQYYINRKKSNYTEVTTLLKRQGIDLDHKRFLILQGEVESIAQMKAKAEKEGEDGLLEYLEDIIGTSKYKQLIEDSMARIEELNTVCQEKADRFSLVEKDKESLDEKKVEALRFLELEKKLNYHTSIQYQYNINQFENKIEERQKEADELEQQLEEKKSANGEVLKSIEIETNKQSEIKKVIKTLSNELDRLIKQRKELSKKNVSLEEKSKNFENKLKKAQKAISSSTHLLNASNQSLSTYSNSSIQYKSEIEKLNSSLEVEENSLQFIRGRLTERTKDYTQKIEDLQKQLEPWTTKLKQNENEIELIISNIKILESQKNSIHTQLEENKQKLMAIKQEGKGKEAELQEKEQTLLAIEEQISLGEDQTDSRKQRLEKMKSQINRAKNKYHDTSQIFQNRQNQNNVLTALTKLGKSGRIDGFYGKLGDLGSIDDKYDVAVSTAVPGLDSMVVETVETAQACIDYLRKNRLGYANFICLNKLRNYDLSPISIPGDPSKIKRLFDLINPINPKFAPAFYSKMFNTLVAPDLNEAKKVAYGARRCKCVTLDGKVIDVAGTMSGGGGQVMRGALRLISAQTNEPDIDEEELEQARNDIQGMESEFKKEQNEYEEDMIKLSKVKAVEPETRLEVDKLKMDIAGLASEMKEVTQICKNLVIEQREMESNNPFEEQIETKTKELQKLEKIRDKIKQEMIETENEISSLEKKIMEAGGTDLKIQSSKVDSIKKQISIVNEKTSGDRMAVKKLESDIKRHTKALEDAKNEQVTIEQDYDTIKEQKLELEKKIKEFEKEINEVEIKKRDQDEELEVTRVAIEEKEEELAGFKSFEVEITNKLEKVTHSLKKLHHLIEENQSQLDSIEIRDPEPYIYWLDEQEQMKYKSNALEKLSEEELQDFDLEAVAAEIEELNKYMSTVKVDVEILKEYGTKISEYNDRKSDLNRAIEERDEKRDYCEDLKRKRLDEFMEGFSKISMTLKDMYRMITMGGNAELELVDSLDPFSEGILFSVMPPKKSWKNISNLSGGEKTLSSLALVFALHSYKPTPLYVMDEIDAALDFRNVSIVANYIKERTKNAQFVVISLRNNMFELAAKLVGIYKVDNKTKSTCIMNI